MRLKRNDGITLFELTITIAIFTILYSLAVPYYHDFKAKQEAQYLPSLLQQYLSRAKHLALTHHNNLVICSSPDLEQCGQDHWGYGFILFFDKNQNKILDNNESLIAKHRTNITYGTLSWKGSLKNSSITFQGDTGLPRGSIGSFYYCSSSLNIQHRVILNMVGGVRHESQSTTC